MSKISVFILKHFFLLLFFFVCCVSMSNVQPSFGSWRRSKSNTCIWIFRIRFHMNQLMAVGAIFCAERCPRNAAFPPRVMGPYGGMPPHPDPGYFASPAQFPFPHPRVVTQTMWSGQRGHPPSRSQSSGRLGSGRSSWETSRASSQTSSQGVAPAGPQAPATPSPRAGKAADTKSRAGRKKESE
jgi:hypothetical protein